MGVRIVSLDAFVKRHPGGVGAVELLTAIRIAANLHTVVGKLRWTLRTTSFRTRHGDAPNLRGGPEK